MTHRNIELVTFASVIEGIDAQIRFVRITVYSPELYGADADGNRGMWMNTCDEDTPSEITIAFGDTAPVGVDTLPPAQRAAVMHAIEVYMESHEPEDTSGDEDPTDYDQEDDDDDQ